MLSEEDIAERRRWGLPDRIFTSDASLIRSWLSETAPFESFFFVFNHPDYQTEASLDIFKGFTMLNSMASVLAEGDYLRASKEYDRLFTSTNWFAHIKQSSSDIVNPKTLEEYLIVRKPYRVDRFTFDDPRPKAYYPSLQIDKDMGKYVVFTDVPLIIP
jgi:hypothetical protein